MFSRKFRYLIVAVLIMGILAVSSGTLAAVAGSVSARIADYISFEFNGKKQPLPAGYTVLLYADRTYVPARFVAEQLGASVFWDGVARTVSINKIPCQNCAALQKEKQDLQQELQKAEREIKDLKQEILDLKKKLTAAEDIEVPSKNYQYLPQWRSLRDLNFEVSLVTEDDDYTRVYIELENKQDVPLQLVQRKSKALAGGTEYKTENVAFHLMDERWYHNVNREEIKEGYIILPAIPKGERNILLTFTVLYNDASQRTTEIEFAVKR